MKAETSLEKGDRGAKPDENWDSRSWGHSVHCGKVLMLFKKSYFSQFSIVFKLQEDLVTTWD